MIRDPIRERPSLTRTVLAAAMGLQAIDGEVYKTMQSLMYPQGSAQNGALLYQRLEEAQGADLRPYYRD